MNKEEIKLDLHKESTDWEVMARVMVRGMFSVLDRVLDKVMDKAMDKVLDKVLDSLLLVMALGLPSGRLPEQEGVTVVLQMD